MPQGSSPGERLGPTETPPLTFRPSPALVYGVLTADRDYTVLYQEVGPALWRAIYAYSGGLRDVADDAVSEAFARAIQHDGTIRRPRSWLYRTAFRITAAEVRRRNRQTELGELSYEQPTGVEEVLVALRKLSPNQRGAVYLHYVGDLPIREIASLLGISITAVKVHLHWGRKRLREILGAEKEETDDV